MLGQPSSIFDGKIFIAYSHRDRRWLERLQIMLKPLVSSAQLTTWADTQLLAGSEWFKEIQIALSSAKVAVLLVTPDFLASNFIIKHELPQLLKANKKKGLSILWIAVSASLYEETEIAKYQALNDPARPLDSLTRAERNQVLVKICQQIKGCANFLYGSSRRSV
jgi:internalin A